MSWRGAFLGLFGGLAWVLGCFRLGLGVGAWWLSSDCQERVIDRFANTEASDRDAGVAGQVATEPLIAELSVRQCRSRPGVSSVQVALAATVSGDSPVPARVIWRGDAGGNAALLHEACGEAVPRVVPRWVGAHHLRIGYDRRVHVTFEETGLLGSGVSVAPSWLPVPQSQDETETAGQAKR